MVRNNRHFRMAGLCLSLVSAAQASFTLVQKATATTTSTTCAPAFSATGTGHVIVYIATTGVSSPTLNSISGGGTYTIQTATGCQGSNSGGLTSYCGYTLSSTSGATAITGNWTNGAATILDCSAWEYSFTASSAVFDKSGTVNHNTSIASPYAGVVLTLTGSNDVIVQSIQSGSARSISGVSAAYGNFVNGASALSIAYADAENTASGAAPSWTAGGAGSSQGAAIAIAESSGVSSVPTLSLLGVGK